MEQVAQYKVAMADANMQQAQQIQSNAQNIMKQAKDKEDRSQAMDAAAQAKLEKASKLEQTAKAQVDNAGAANAKAAATMQRAESMANDAQSKASQSNTQMKQAAVEKSRAEQDIGDARNQMEQASREKSQAEQSIAKAKLEKAEVTALKASNKSLRQQNTRAAAVSAGLSYFLAGLCVVLIVSFSMLWFLKLQLSRARKGVQEPLLTPEEKPHEGTWKRDDGKVVSISGGEASHSDGKQEQVSEFRNGDLYSKRTTLERGYGKRGWLVDKPIEKSARGKVLGTDRIEWDDGRVWTKAEVGAKDTLVGA